MTEPRRVVFLAGFMGSGKSTIGPELARRIGYDFVDLDDVIERAEGISIADIFKSRGEKYFREAERRMLRELLECRGKVVVALGGGTLTSEESRNLVRNEGILVYLKANRKKILERVREERNRPMLLTREGNTLNDAELTDRIEALFKDREAHYMEASIIVDTSESPVPECAKEIASQLKGLME